MSRTFFFIISLTLFASLNFNYASGNVDSITTTLNSKTKFIRKCCSIGDYVDLRKRCTTVDIKFQNLTTDFSDVFLYDKNVQPTGRRLPDVYTIHPGALLNVTFDEMVYDYTVIGHNYYLTEDGILYEEVPNEYKRWYSLDVNNFCVDYKPIRVKNKIVPRFWTKLDEPPPTNDEGFITVGLLVSCVFLTLVLLVYCLLPELRNLGGLVLMAYVFSLLFAFLLLAIIQMSQHSDTNCLLLTFSIYFFFLASFFWMNVMSLDIWWTFRGYAKARPIHRRGERFKFAMYCLYAWGLPLAMTVMLIVLNTVNMRHLPWFVTPNLLKRGCFIPEEPKFFYLYIPMLILILSNWMFFLMTAFNIWRLHRSTAMLDSAAAGTPAAHRKQRYRLMVYLKLSIIMGINWVLEVVSSFSPNLKVWYITDGYNLLIGVCIFLIFVCKKKIFRMLLKRFRAFNVRWRRGRSSERSSYSKSRSSNTTDSDITQDTPLQIQVCQNPKGPVFFEKR